MSKIKKTADKPDIKAVDVVKEIGDLQLNVQSTLAGISAAITGKLDQLKNTDLAIADSEARLKEVFAIEKELLDIEVVRKQREDEELEYEKQIEVRNRELMEQEAARAKKWKREEDDYAYEFAQKCKKAQDEFQAALDTKQRQEKIRQEELAKNWQVRENSLKEHEKELTDLRTQVAGFDAKMRKELEETVKCLTTEMGAKHQQQIQLLMKDKEAESSINSEKVSSLNATIATLQKQITGLEAQLLQARQDAKEVTSQALTASAGKQTNDALLRMIDSNKDAKK